LIKFVNNIGDDFVLFFGASSDDDEWQHWKIIAKKNNLNTNDSILITLKIINLKIDLARSCVKLKCKQQP
jgi:hypothetical protein